MEGAQNMSSSFLLFRVTKKSRYIGKRLKNFNIYISCPNEIASLMDQYIQVEAMRKEAALSVIQVGG